MIKIRKELWFGLGLMALIIVASAGVLLAADTITRGHLGLLMLAMVVVAIMRGTSTKCYAHPRPHSSCAPLHEVQN